MGDEVDRGQRLMSRVAQEIVERRAAGRLLQPVDAAEAAIVEHHEIVPGAVQSPACSKCSAPMRLVKIGRYRPRCSIPIEVGIKEHSFECPKCRHSENWVFAATQAASVGGAAGLG